VGCSSFFLILLPLPPMKVSNWQRSQVDWKTILLLGWRCDEEDDVRIQREDPAGGRKRGAAKGVLLLLQPSSGWPCSWLS